MYLALNYGSTYEIDAVLLLCLVSNFDIYTISTYLIGGEWRKKLKMYLMVDFEMTIKFLGKVIKFNKMILII